MKNPTRGGWLVVARVRAGRRSGSCAHGMPVLGSGTVGVHAPARCPSRSRDPGAAPVASTSPGAPRPRGRRPGWMSQVAALASWMCTLGSRATPKQVVGRVPGDEPVCRPSGTAGQTWWTAAADVQRRHPVGDQNAGLDRRAGGDDRRPAAMARRPRSAASSGDTSQNISGCSSDRYGQRPAHPAGGVVLGQPVGGEHVGEHLTIAARRRRVRRGCPARP